MCSSGSERGAMFRTIGSLPPASIFFLLITIAGTLLVIAITPSSPYVVLGLASLAILFSFLLTVTRFSEISRPKMGYSQKKGFDPGFCGQSHCFWGLFILLLLLVLSSAASVSLRVA